MILIAGVSSSGSTFLTRLLGELGFELGEVLDNEGLARGAEWEPMARLLSRWEMINSPMPLTIHGAEVDQYKRTPSMQEFFRGPWPDAARTPIARLSNIVPEVVKSSIICRWLDAWLTLGGKRPEHVIVCHRPLEQVTESFIRDRLAGYGEERREEVRSWLSMSYGMLMDALHKWEIGYTVVRFPQSVEDSDYCWQVLSEVPEIDKTGYVYQLDHFRFVHSALADPDLIHVKEEETSDG